MYNKDQSRLYVQTRLRDCTGAVDVEIPAKYVPPFYNCKTEDEVKVLAEKNELQPILHRVNARGLLRSENGHTRKIIGDFVVSPLQHKHSDSAYKAMLGLSEVVGDIVVPSPAENVVDQPMIGLAVQSDQQVVI